MRCCPVHNERLEQCQNSDNELKILTYSSDPGWFNFSLCFILMGSHAEQCSESMPCVFHWSSPLLCCRKPRAFIDLAQPVQNSPSPIFVPISRHILNHIFILAPLLATGPPMADISYCGDLTDYTGLSNKADQEKPIQRPNIASLAAQALEAFERCLYLSASYSRDSAFRVDYHLRDFEHWTYKAGVFSPGRACLDHAVRPADFLHDGICSDLKNLIQRIQDCEYRAHFHWTD